MTKRYKDYPDYILDVIKMECDKQGSKFDINAEYDAGRKHGGFGWSDSLIKDNGTFWVMVLNPTTIQEGIDYFNNNINYDWFPGLKPKITSYKVIEDRTQYYINNKGKKYRVTIEEEL